MVFILRVVQGVLGIFFGGRGLGVEDVVWEFLRLVVCMCVVGGVKGFKCGGGVCGLVFGYVVVWVGLFFFNQR